MIALFCYYYGTYLLMRRFCVWWLGGLVILVSFILFGELIRLLLPLVQGALINPLFKLIFQFMDTSIVLTLQVSLHPAWHLIIWHSSSSFILIHLFLFVSTVSLLGSFFAIFHVPFHLPSISFRALALVWTISPTSYPVFFICCFYNSCPSIELLMPPVDSEWLIGRCGNLEQRPSHMLFHEGSLLKPCCVQNWSLLL